jgi:REP element-mobilizing transposase RayT
MPEANERRPVYGPFTLRPVLLGPAAIGGESSSNLFRSGCHAAVPPPPAGGGKVIALPAQSYFDIYLHITWHTKNSAPLIAENVRPKLYAFLEQRARAQKGVVIHAIGGTENHVHIAATIPPTLAVSAWIGELKGASVYYANQRILNRKGALDWQSGYGVVRFGAKDLPWVVEYIETQEARHRERKVAARLERYEGPLAASRRRP